MTGNEFRAMRALLGDTQTALALRLDMGVRQIRNFETDAWPVPRVVELALTQLVASHVTTTKEANDAQPN